MLVDAENPRTWGAAPFGALAAEVILEPAFHGGTSDAFPPA
jgi:hypothetical protein